MIAGILARIGVGGLATLALWAPHANGSELAGPGLTLSRIGSDLARTHERLEFTLAGIGPQPNPGDSSAIRVDLEIATPAGRALRVPAFYYQPFEFRPVRQGNRRREWFYPLNPAQWRARFTAETPGTYEAVAVAADAAGERRSPALRFTCAAGNGKGFVRVSTPDPRFFGFSDGAPLFPIGQNVAFVGQDQYLDTERAGEVFAKLAANGANFARVWVCAEDWALGVEARKSAWGRSWDWRPPFVPLPGRDGYHSDELCVRLGGTGPDRAALDPPHPVAVRPGARYRLTGSVLTGSGNGLQIEWDGRDLGEPVRGEKAGQWAPFVRPVTAASNQWWLGRLTLRTTAAGPVWLRDLSLLSEPEGGPELLTEAAPRLGARGIYNPVDSFMLDRLVEAAEQHGIYLQLCLLTRDHYLHDLRDPTGAAYQQALDDARKFLRYAVARWGYSTHVLAWEYFNEMDPGAPTGRFHRELGEFLERNDPYRHLRTTSGWGPAPNHWTHPQLDIADLHHYLRPNAPPAWQDEVAAVLDRAALVRRHAPGKPALLGEFGLADEKWGLSPHMKQDREGVHFHNALWASAFSGLSGTAMFWWWETLDQLDAYRHYRPLAKFLAGIPFTATRLEAVTQLTEGAPCRWLAWRGSDRAYGWVFNPQATWWNRVVEAKPPAAVIDAVVALGELEDGTYQAQWWDPWTGEVLQQATATASAGRLNLSVPPFTSDIAWKLTR